MMRGLWQHLRRFGSSVRFRRDVTGQSLVEFAAVAPVFLLLVFGFMQIGLWTFGIALTQTAVREGCRAGIAQYQPRPAWWDRQESCGGWTGRCDPTQTNGTLELQARLIAIARTRELLETVRLTSGNLVLATIEEASDGRGREGRREIVVTAHVNLVTVVPLFGRSFLHTSQCRMRLERFYSY